MYLILALICWSHQYFLIHCVNVYVLIQNIKCKIFMLIVDVLFDTVFILYHFIAYIAGKQCLTKNHFYMKEVLYISYCTFPN